MASNSVGMFQRPIEYKVGFIRLDESLKYYAYDAMYTDTPPVRVGEDNNIKYVILEQVVNIKKYVSDAYGKFFFKKNGQIVYYNFEIGYKNDDPMLNALFLPEDIVGSTSFTFQSVACGNIDQSECVEISKQYYETFKSLLLSNLSEYEYLIQLVDGEIKQTEPWVYATEILTNRFKEKIGLNFEYKLVNLYEYL